jgi:hypothetical protein
VDGTTTCQNPGWARTIQEAINGAIMSAIRAVVPVIVVPPALYDERLNVGGSAAVRIVAGPSPSAVASGGRSWSVQRLGVRSQTGTSAPVVRPSGGGSVVTIDEGATLILDGFVLEGGTGTPMEIDVYNPSSGQWERRIVNSGAGIVNKGTLSLANSRLTANDAGQLGSIIYTAPGASSSLDGSTIADNAGTAIMNKGATTVSSTAIDGTQPRNGGCAVSNDPGATLAMTDAAVTDTVGAGVCNSGDLTLLRTAIDRNSHMGIFHTGINQAWTPSLAMDGGSLSGNGWQGLLSWVTSAGVASLDGVTIDGNGGEGIYRMAGTLNMTGGSVANNRNGGVNNIAANTCYNPGTGTVCTGPDVRTMTMTSVEVTGNSERAPVVNGDGARMVLVDVDIHHNTSTMIAGGIMNGDWSHTQPDRPAILTMTGGRITDNYGPLSALQINLSTTTLRGVTLSGNTMSSSGLPAISQAGGTLTMDEMSIDGGLSAYRDCWLRPCTTALQVTPLTTVRDSAFGGLLPAQGVAIPYGLVERSTFTGATLGGGCDLDVRDSVMTGSGINAACYVDGAPGAGRISVSGTTITGGWSGFWNLGVTADLSATITGASTGIYHSAGTTAIGPGSRITGNVVGVRNLSADPAAVTGVDPTTVFGNGTDCINVAGCA